MCVLSCVCALCVDVGFESEGCISQLILNMNLVNVGLGTNCFLSSGRGSSPCLKLGVECEFCVDVGFEGDV